jgi:hypothetical protein
MKTTIIIIRFVLWISVCNSTRDKRSNVSTVTKVPERFCLFTDKKISREEVPEFIRTCNDVSDELYCLIHSNQIICNLSHLLNINLDVLHSNLYQAMLYVDNNKISDTIQQVVEAIIFIYHLLLEVKDNLVSFPITDKTIISLTNDYFNSVGNDRVLESSVEDIVAYISKHF